MLEVLSPVTPTAHDRWLDEKQKAYDRCGATAAEERYGQICDEKLAGEQLVASKRALTRDGLLAKLGFIVGDYDVEELNDNLFGDGSSDMILASVLRDYKLSLEARA